jgi:hypothetical protein
MEQRAPPYQERFNMACCDSTHHSAASVVYRRNLSLKAKFESGSSHFAFKL